MGLFGNLFDFNRDGKTSFTEQIQKMKFLLPARKRLTRSSP